MPLSPQPPAAVPTQCLNYVWLGDTFARADEPYKDPMPPGYVPNLIQTAATNPHVDIYIWVDYRRLTKQQLGFFQHAVAQCLSANVSIRDLLTIPGYRNEPLYQGEEANKDWRGLKHSLIWRQVDAARVLVCIASLASYDQVFYADWDITNLDINSDVIQRPVLQHGIVVSGKPDRWHSPCIENQMMGFGRKQCVFMNDLYCTTIEDAKRLEINGYDALRFLCHKLAAVQKIQLIEILFGIQDTGVPAHCPNFAARIANCSAKESFKLEYPV